MVRIPRVAPRTIVEIESLAESVVRQFQPNALKELVPFDVESFLENELESFTGISFGVLELPNGLDGYTDPGERICVISSLLYDDADNIVTYRRLRSTIAHEIGHCLLHVPNASEPKELNGRFENDGAFPIERYNPEDLRAFENPEWQAWRFASALLMPAACFRRAVSVGWTMKRIQNAFEVNSSFVESRKKQLSIPQSIRRG